MILRKYVFCKVCFVYKPIVHVTFPCIPYLNIILKNCFVCFRAVARYFKRIYVKKVRVVEWFCISNGKDRGYGLDQSVETNT